MAQSLAKVLLHVVFSTKERRPFLRNPQLREETHRYLGGILNGLGCPSIAVGGVEDHVHVLSTLSRTHTISDLIKEVKRSSSLWIKDREPELAAFAWQGGYSAFSLVYSQLEKVRHYIANQEEHHRRQSFQDEFRELLRRYQIPYDEAYVWD